MRNLILPVFAFSLLFAASILFKTPFEVVVKSSAQKTNRNTNDSRSINAPSGEGAKQDFSKNTWELPADAENTKNPVPFTAQSVRKGRNLYFNRDKANCAFCHGDTGSGNEANLAKLRRKPADLTNMERMDSMTDGELFWKISKGIKGIMPAGEGKMTDEERWHLVNYVRTLQKEPQ